MTYDALVADEGVVGKASPWEIALYGSVGGLLVVLPISTIGFFINRRKASVSKQPIGESIEASAQCEPSTLSPGIAISEAAFERELEEEVATINAAQDGAVLVDVRGQLGTVYRFAWNAIEPPSDPDAGDRRVSETFARDTQAAPESATSGNSAAIMISSASWTKRILASAMPWTDRAFGAIVVEISTPVVGPVAADRKLEVLWSRVNDTAPPCVGDGVGVSDRVELVQKKGDVELGGVGRDAEPTGDRLV